MKRALGLGARYYSRGVKFSKESELKGFVKDTHHDLWPWVVGRAGYLVQCGELTLIGVPKYLLNMASAPVLYVTVLAAKGARALLAPISRPPGRIEFPEARDPPPWGGGVKKFAVA